MQHHGVSRTECRTRRRGLMHRDSHKRTIVGDWVLCADECCSVLVQNQQKFVRFGRACRSIDQAAVALRRGISFFKLCLYCVF
ncbi:hypothetical protein HA402_009103 [Bradysia odoriphaga]|nr:hypothetical protein HA402_009103 [Bradysia odoriphaga]